MLEAIARETGGSPRPSTCPTGPCTAPAAPPSASRGHRLAAQPIVTRLGVKLFGTDNRHAIDKARRELGYRPQIAIRDGIRLAAAWYQAQGEPTLNPDAVAEGLTA